MKYRAILLDLDGTLLPMDNDVFTKCYFKELAKKLSPIGVAPDALVAAVWAGTKDMVKNDGSRRNVDVFWDRFAQAIGQDAVPYRAASDAFYRNEFHRVKSVVGENPLAREAVHCARETGVKVVCASNPLFPKDGQLTRLSWIGLKDEDFDYVCSYESESFSKPNPEFYRALAKALGVAPQECLMVGNDVREDVLAAQAAGMDGWLTTDCLKETEGFAWNGPKGSFAELVDFLKECR